MKKLITIIAVFLTVASQAQNLDTVNVSLTLRAQDWAWLTGKYGTGGDSATKAKIRQMRDAIRTANPQTWTANVTINNIPGHIVVWMYHAFATAPFGEVWEMGTTVAERTTIATTIKAINNAALQYFIGTIDANVQSLFINNRQRGKEILIDN